MSKPAVDSQTGRTRRVSDLERRIAESRHLRSLVRDPDLVAVRMDTSRKRTLAGLWTFLALGLVFTTTGVQQFLAGDRVISDPMWWAAWCVEPMFAGLLIVLLNFEAVILSHGITPDHAWWTRLKHTLLASTLAMNVIPQLAPLTGDGAFNLGSLAVHAIIPIIVYGLAEVIPVIQARARQVIHHSYDTTDHHTPTEPEPSPEGTEPSPVPDSDTPEPSETAPEESAESAAVELADKTSGSEPSESDSEPGPARLAPVRPSSVRLPESVLNTLTTAREEAYSSGRSLSATDIQRLTKLPERTSAQLAEELAVPDTNGHAMS
ncbi:MULTISPECIES: hypothetical protein [unclassified Actinopolyspora]|uniref:hypothetical protein n=1 Tax=unclassified Actinopolyspora TaxID=2639451 RepID=UPI001A981FE3|nr:MULTISPECIES: hypothetical protein [unclassified Actinopolyspora]